MNDRKLFFERAIKENPRDMNLRQVYADWLEELGDGGIDDDLAKHHREWTLEKQDALEWLNDFVLSHVECDEDYFWTIVESYISGSTMGHGDWDDAYLMSWGQDLHGDYSELAGKFWDAYELVHGRRPENGWDKSLSFNCAC